ncbi:hypothetical protein I3W98_28825, partial [Streptomyces cavourensis]|nr:hypothetical protein [Streptomyces cavourensis]
MAGRFAPRTTGPALPHQAAPAARRRTGAPPPGAGAEGRTEPPLTREWTPSGPLDLRLVLGPLRRGPADPTFRMTPDGAFWRATRTPEGPGTLRVAARGDRVGAEAWGPASATWAGSTTPPAGWTGW